MALTLFRRRGDGNADRRYVGDALRGREVQ
jgi:hypothetical protein